MLSRRNVLIGAAGIITGTASLRAHAEAILTDDGLYRQPWFLDSFLELADDLDGAAEKGKRFALIWELRGCPYCRKTHLVNFARPEIQRYVKETFEILQLNIVGSREVTDFDGEKLTEKRLAQKYEIRYTPTLQFFPGRSAEVSGSTPRKREVARFQGYLEPGEFHALFRFVAERSYERGSFDDYLRQTNGRG